MRVVKIDGQDLKLVRALLAHGSRVEVAIDSEGFKVRYRGHWTPGYGVPQQAQRYTIENDPEPPSVDELIERAEIVYRLGEDTDG